MRALQTSSAQDCKDGEVGFFQRQAIRGLQNVDMILYLCWTGREVPNLYAMTMARDCSVFGGIHCQRPAKEWPCGRRGRMDTDDAHFLHK